MNKKIKISDLRQDDWESRKDAARRAPNHMRLWLRKSLFNFAGAAHQIHFQKSCNYSIRKFYSLEPETCTLHALYGQYELLMSFKRNILLQLHQDVLGLAEEDLNPLVLLKSVF